MYFSFANTRCDIRLCLYCYPCIRENRTFSLMKTFYYNSKSSSVYCRHCSPLARLVQSGDHRWLEPIMLPSFFIFVNVKVFWCVRNGLIFHPLVLVASRVFLYDGCRTISSMEKCRKQDTGSDGEGVKSLYHIDGQHGIMR